MLTDVAPRPAAWRCRAPTGRAPAGILVYGLAAVLFVAYAAVSVSRHLRMRTSGYDLGIFEQAVRGYARLRAPIAELKGPGFNLLGDHFHPILALLAPWYRLFPSPITLLVAQAALLAWSAVPITRLAMRTLGSAAGLGIGVAYGLSWGLQRAVGFDFHEICFAVPLLAYSLERLVRRQWGAAVAWAVPLVLVKEDLPLTLAAVGGYLMLRGQRRLGATVFAFAIAAGFVIAFVVIPAINPGHVYSYADTAASTAQNPVLRLITPAVKLQTLVLLVIPTGFLALRSPLLLLTVPTLAWRFWSTNHNYWGTSFHHSAILMPIVFVALIDALRVNRYASLRRLATLVPALAVTVAAVLCLGLPLRDLADPQTWRTDPWAATARATLAAVPNGASVAANNRLAPQLTARCQVYLFPTYPDTTIRPDWIAVTDPPDTGLSSTTQTNAALAALPDLGYRVAVRHNGIILYQHQP